MSLFVRHLRQCEYPCDRRRSLAIQLHCTQSCTPSLLFPLRGIALQSHCVADTGISFFSCRDLFRHPRFRARRSDSAVRVFCVCFSPAAPAWNVLHECNASVLRSIGHSDISAAGPLFADAHDGNNFHSDDAGFRHSVHSSHPTRERAAASLVGARTAIRMRHPSPPVICIAHRSAFHVSAVPSKQCQHSAANNARGRYGHHVHGADRSLGDTQLSSCSSIHPYGGQ